MSFVFGRSCSWLEIICGIWLYVFLGGCAYPMLLRGWVDDVVFMIVLKLIEEVDVGKYLCDVLVFGILVRLSRGGVGYGEWYIGGYSRRTVWSRLRGHVCCGMWSVVVLALLGDC